MGIRDRFHHTIVIEVSVFRDRFAKNIALDSNIPPALKRH